LGARGVGSGARGGGGRDTAARGREGEDLAAAFLEAEGWTITARNYRWRGGEIDIVAAREGTIAFVEVKSWGKLGAEELERAIGADKRRRIVETAKIFLSRHREYNDWSVRFDVILVRGGVVVERYRSAFTGEL
jgi:putative endonuclease